MANLPEDRRKLLNIRLNDIQPTTDYEQSTIPVPENSHSRQNEGENLHTTAENIPAPATSAWTRVSADDDVSAILSQLNRKSSDTARYTTEPLRPLVEMAEEMTPRVDDLQLLQQEQVEDLPPRSRGRRLVDRILYSIGNVVPKRGDPLSEIVRKSIFIVALVVLIGSSAYIFNEMFWLPMVSEKTYEGVAELFDPNNPVEPPADFPAENYPDGIADSFKALYAKNQDTLGWMTYRDANNSWLKINYPVMYSGDNEYYLDHDFQKAKNKSGALFFDYRTSITKSQPLNRVFIIYGHNLQSEQMFSKFNKMMNNLQLMRSAPTLSLDTLYGRNEYKVFAVMLLSTKEEHGPYFDALRTQFSSDSEYMDFVAEIRARSVYDFNDVTVKPDDNILILQTCTAVSTAKFDDGRCVVVARRVREGESTAVRPPSIVLNSDVIRPLIWYQKQKLKVHPYYTDSSYRIPNAWTGETGGTYPTVSNPSSTITSPGSTTTATGTGGGTTGPTESTRSGTGPSGTNTTVASGSTNNSGTTSPTSSQTNSQGSDTTTESTETPTTEETTASTEPPTEAPTEPMETSGDAE